MRHHETHESSPLHHQRHPDGLGRAQAAATAELQDLLLAGRFCRSLAAAADRRAFLRDLLAFLPRPPPAARAGRGGEEDGQAAGPAGDAGGGEEGGEEDMGGGDAEAAEDVTTGTLIKELQGLPDAATGRQARPQQPQQQQPQLIRSGSSDTQIERYSDRAILR